MGGHRMVAALIIGIPAALLCLLIVWPRCRASALDDELAAREIARCPEHEGDDSAACGHQEPRCGDESGSGTMDASPPQRVRHGATTPIVPFAGLSAPKLVFADDEVCALDGIIHALEPLDHGARRRVLAHIRARYLPDETEEAPHG